MLTPLDCLLLEQRREAECAVLLCRMSEAVEGAVVIIYCVSEGYKESANCRLEANYA